MHFGPYEHMFDMACKRFTAAADALNRWCEARPMIVASVCPYARSLLMEMIEALEIELHVLRMLDEVARADVIERIIMGYERLLEERPPPAPPSQGALSPGPFFVARHIRQEW